MHHIVIAAVALTSRTPATAAPCQGKVVAAGSCKIGANVGVDLASEIRLNSLPPPMTT